MTVELKPDRTQTSTLVPLWLQRVQVVHHQVAQRQWALPLEGARCLSVLLLLPVALLLALLVQTVTAVPP